jgi:hypothetical protein
MFFSIFFMTSIINKYPKNAFTIKCRQVSETWTNGVKKGKATCPQTNILVEILVEN